MTFEQFKDTIEKLFMYDKFDNKNPEHIKLIEKCLDSSREASKCLYHIIYSKFYNIHDELQNKLLEKCLENKDDIFDVLYTLIDNGKFNSNNKFHLQFLKILNELFHFC